VERGDKKKKLHASPGKTFKNYLEESRTMVRQTARGKEGVNERKTCTALTTQ